MSNPFVALHAALASAELKDLPDVEYETRDWDAWKKDGTDIRVKKFRRPQFHELEVDMFLQGWSSTALGYGGVGGQAFTDAYTVVVSYGSRYYCVYFGCGVLAYKVDLNSLAGTGRAAFTSDLRDHYLADVQKAATRYV